MAVRNLIPVLMCLSWSTDACGQGASQVRVLSVCEVLQHLSAYRGKAIVLVAQAGLTFEGTFADQRCSPDERISIQGHRWLSMIAVSRTSAPLTPRKSIPVDDAALWAKVRQIQREFPISNESKTAHEGDWVALYGVVESPKRLIPHRRPGGTSQRKVPGNGYGANGSVPANLALMSEKILIRGRHPFRLRIPGPPFALPEPPALAPPPPTLARPPL
jgi:hypothetical protein